MSKHKKQLPPRPLNERREAYLRVFLLSFACMLLLMAPVMIFTGGYFIYYGDFNSQQLPFYHLAHSAVTHGDFGWNWQTDLGTNFIGSYSFYLLGSPFFWLTTLFPENMVLYLIPYLLALKTAVASLTAYAYIRRFVRNRNAALIGGLLYAFSGFQLYNVFFNHFHDVTALFPLMLIAMEQRINENRRGVFALTVALMAIINYYFFTGQAVFLVLYFILRCPAKDFHADLRKFFSLGLEAVLGTAMAAFMLLPSALAILENYRVKSYLWGLDMVTYTDRTRIWRIIQSFFMIPDSPARPNLFQSDHGKWASIGGYLPMYSMAGVIAFMSQKKKHWATRLVAVCAVCALIPILNSMFYALNGSYYARWFYMPILIMALMTAYALDNPKIRWRGGIITCAAFFAAFGIISLLPTKDADGNIKMLEFAKYGWYFWLTLALCAIMLYFVILVAAARRRGRPFYRPAVWCTVFCCLCTGFSMIYFGIGLGAYPTAYVNTAINGGSKISLEDVPNQFYRVDISQDYDNYPMFWGYSNMRCFHSIVPVSVMDFYDTVDVQRDVASRPETKHYGLRELFSVKYYFDRFDPDKADKYTFEIPEMPSFKYVKRENDFYIYENEAYIPMGLTYDYYIDSEELKNSVPVTMEKLMVKALALTPEQAAKYGDILEPLPDAEKYGLDDTQFVAYCQSRAAEACDRFDYDSYGFNAHITLETPKMVFFSVPYESGWTAEVNGRPVDAERVSYGFMAVRCEAGSNEISFHYETPGLRIGAIVSACAAGGLLLYLLIMLIVCRGKRLKVPKQKYCYDYDSIEQISEHALYLTYARQKHPETQQPVRPQHSEEPPADMDTDTENYAENDAADYVPQHGEEETYDDGTADGAASEGDPDIR